MAQWDADDFTEEGARSGRVHLSIFANREGDPPMTRLQGTLAMNEDELVEAAARECVEMFATVWEGSTSLPPIIFTEAEEVSFAVALKPILTRVRAEAIEQAAGVAERFSRLTPEQAKHYGDGPHLIAAAIRALS